MQGENHLTVVGIDVAKQTLDWTIAGQTKTHHINYDQAGLDQLIEACCQAKAALVVLEATGDLERRLVRALAQAGIAFHVANPRKVRDFAKALGRLAKTDSIDAQILVEYGQRLQPKPHELPSESRQKLNDWSARHQQLSKMRVAELNRLKACLDEAIAETIEQHLLMLDEQIQVVAEQMDALIDDDAAMATDAERLTSTPGVGRLTARRLLAEMPEIGSCKPRQLASLVGLAPMNRDSGTLRGKRVTGGGRKSVRTFMYMPTLVAAKRNPVIREMYQRLIAAGKPPKVALTACMRKLLILLNAMIREQKNWEEFTQMT